MTKSDQIWGITKTRLCKVFEIQQLAKSCCASGGNRTRTAVSGQGIFVPLWLSPPVSVCGLDYSFTVGPDPLGVPCLVSAPSSFQRLGSRLPSALPVKVSLNLRHSTLSLSGQALKFCLSPSCLPFHHQGKMWECKDKDFIVFLQQTILRGLVIFV